MGASLEHKHVLILQVSDASFHNTKNYISFKTEIKALSVEIANKREVIGGRVFSQHIVSWINCTSFYRQPFQFFFIELKMLYFYHIRFPTV